MLGTYKAIGPLDTATAPVVNADLHDTIDGSDEAFVSVDCSGVTFLDPAGYYALVDATNYAVRRGHTLVIRNMSPACATLMRLYDWDRELRFESLGNANEYGPAPGAHLADGPTPGSRVEARSERVDISEDDDGWCAECFVCHSWVSTHNKTRVDAANAFGRHLQDDYPHGIREHAPRGRSLPPSATATREPEPVSRRGAIASTHSSLTEV